MTIPAPLDATPEGDAFGAGGVRAPRRIVVMGVSGSGKSTVGEALAADLGAAFLDADDLHDAEAVAKMTAGTPLTDDDRAPWLTRVGAALEQTARERGTVVIACSALRRRYRDLIREGASGPVAFVLLEVDADALRRRMSHRAHFMPVSLLESQLATLEPLEPDELGGTVAAGAPLAGVVAEAKRLLG